MFWLTYKVTMTIVYSDLQTIYWRHFIKSNVNSSWKQLVNTARICRTIKMGTCLFVQNYYPRKNKVCLTW